MAREGKIKEFTGISDPFEHPEEPEILVELDNLENQVNKVLSYLQDKGLVKDDRLL